MSNTGALYHEERNDNVGNRFFKKELEDHGHQPIKLFSHKAIVCQEPTMGEEHMHAVHLMIINEVIRNIMSWPYFLAFCSEDEEGVITK
ncbi:hypothetical protein BH18THE2_BH18THE2_30950 [soil metagenome]